MYLCPTNHSVDSTMAAILSTLARAVSEVQIRIDVWATPHIFQLFVVLIEPPTDLGLNAIEGLQDYLTQLLVKVGCLIENGIHGITTHCWYALLGKRSHLTFHRSDFYISAALCSNRDKPRKWGYWIPIPKDSRNLKGNSSTGALLFPFLPKAGFQGRAIPTGVW